MPELRLFLLVVCSLTAIAFPIVAVAQEEIEWTTSNALSGEVIDGELFLEVHEAGTYPLLALDEPGVGPPRFALQTGIRHEAVEGVAFLEMWTILPDGSRYFTRTLADSGPMGVITGSSEDRPLLLPFELGEGGPTPSRLEISLVSEGPGRFWLRPFTVTNDGVGTTTTHGEAVGSGTTSGPTSTVAVTGDPLPIDETGPSVWWPWAGGVVFALAGLGLLARHETRRRRREEEERRMNATDIV